MRAILAASILFALQPALQATPQVSRTKADATLPPRGFGSVRFEVKNPSSEPREFQLKAQVSTPLQLTSAATRTLKLPAHGAEIVVYNLYAPLGTQEGGNLQLQVTDLSTQETASATHRFGITPQPALESKALTPNGDLATLLRSKGSASTPWELVLTNTGNTPLQIELESQCSPASATLTGLPSSVPLSPGETKRLPAILQNNSTAFTEAVARVRVTGIHGETRLEPVFHFVRLENYPDPQPAKPADLYETLHSTATFAAGFVNEEAVFLQMLQTEGMVAPQTKLQFFGQLSSFDEETVSLPGYESDSYFRLSLINPKWRLDAGEVRHDFGRLIAPSEQGDGVRAEVQVTPKFRFTVFAAESNYTHSDKQMAGATVAYTPIDHHTLELQGLTVRDDPDPRKEHWSVGSASWIYSPSKNLRLEVEGACGANSEGTGGGAVGANLLWRAKPWDMPMELQLEGGTGGVDFPGSQQGLTDGRIHLWLQPHQKLDLRAMYYRSHYESEPFYEETLEELRSIRPDFTRRVTSNLTSVSATLRQEIPVTLTFQEQSSFQRSEFSERSTERSLTLTATKNDPHYFAMLTLEAGTEDREGRDPASSRFGVIGIDTSIPIQTASGNWNLQGGVRYIQNFDGDKEAVNRTGLLLNAGATFTPTSSRFTTRWQVDAYGYEQGDRALRARAGLHYRLSPQQQIGIEGSYTLQRSSQRTSREETAVLFVYRYSFDTPLPWMPTRGSTMGTIYNDLNLNGLQDPGETGVPGVAVHAGSHRTLTGPKGEFTFPAMEPGETALTFADPEGTPLHFSGTPPEKTLIRPGKIGEMAVGIVVPLRIDGTVTFTEDEVSLTQSSFDILATQDSREVRSFTRGDGSFSLYLEPGDYVITPQGLEDKYEVFPPSVKVTMKAGETPKPVRFTIKEKQRTIKRKVFTQN